MYTYVPRWLLFLLALLFAPAISAQQPSHSAQPGDDTINLNVVVTHKSGPPVTGLQQRDFTLLDNNVPQTITSFRAINGRKSPIQVIILIDALNAPYRIVSYERGQIDKVLRADGGDLAYPTELAVLTDTGLQTAKDFSTDGNALSAALDQYSVALRSIVRSSGFYGAAERFQLSLEGLHKLVQRESSRPGRRIVLCISPGWPVLSGPEVELSSSERQQLFADIVDFSADFGRNNITLYSINPWGPGEPLGRKLRWESFGKGISKPSQVNAGDLALQVLATQSGGLALNSNDVAAELQHALVDVSAYYEISFSPSTDNRPDEYHRLQVRIAKPGLTARTRQGYYSGAKGRGKLKVPTPIESGDSR
ncbi:MAG: VWA domain-containing protein [Candidatus Acidiferrales bacterium]